MNIKESGLEKVEAERERLSTVANIGNLLGHPIRLKIVSILMDHEGASWTDIVKGLERMVGRLNPNTVNFHLSKLILGGIVEKKGDDRYFITESMKDNRILKSMLAELKGREV